MWFSGTTAILWFRCGGSWRKKLEVGHVRLRGLDEWERISWDEALDLKAAELKRILDEHGNEAILELGSTLRRGGTAGCGRAPLHLPGGGRPGSRRACGGHGPDCGDADPSAYPGSDGPSGRDAAGGPPPASPSGRRRLPDPSSLPTARAGHWSVAALLLLGTSEIVGRLLFYAVETVNPF